MSCGETDRDVIDFVMATLPQFGLYPFEARRESTGFIFNRVWAAVKREVSRSRRRRCVHPQDVDRMFEINTGSAGGPFRMMDQVGLDVVLDIEEHYCAEHPEYPEGPRKLLSTYMSKAGWGSSPERASTTTTHSSDDPSAARVASARACDRSDCCWWSSRLPPCSYYLR